MSLLDLALIWACVTGVLFGFALAAEQRGDWQHANALATTAETAIWIVFFLILAWLGANNGG